MNKNLIEKLLVIIFILLFIGIILIINYAERNYCESHNGTFIFGYGDRNKCIYK